MGATGVEVVGAGTGVVAGVTDILGTGGIKVIEVVSGGDLNRQEICGLFPCIAWSMVAYQLVFNCTSFGSLLHAELRSAITWSY